MTIFSQRFIEMIQQIYNTKILLFIISIIGILFPYTTFTQSSFKNWKEVASGLWYEEFKAPQKSISGDSRISVLKIDTGKFSMHLVLSAQSNRQFRTAKEWAHDNNLTAVINAGMYRENGIHTGYVKNYTYENKSTLTPAYKSMLAFNPKNGLVPSVKMIDLQYDDFHSLKNNYNSLVQNIRMIDSHQENRWSRQPKISSITALGMDTSGDIIFVFCRSPYTGHDFTAMLLMLPLNLYQCMYLEGGAVASLYIKSGEFEIEKSGGFETGIFSNETTTVLLPVPNVIGIKERGD